jgi:hypothetical protein
MIIPGRLSATGSGQPTRPTASQGPAELAEGSLLRDFVVLMRGSCSDVEDLHEEIAGVLAPLDLRLSPAKTRIGHMSEAFDFLGFRIQWRRKKGTDKWYVYTFIADRPLRSLKAKIRALTRRTSQQDLGTVLIRLNQIMRGWVNYFKHAVAKHTFKVLEIFAWRRVIQMLIEHRRRGAGRAAQAEAGEVALQGPLVRGPAQLGAQDPADPGRGPIRVLPPQPHRQLHDLGRGPRAGLPRVGDQRVEPAGPPVPDPPVHRLPRHPDPNGSVCSGAAIARTNRPRCFLACTPRPRGLSRAARYAEVASRDAGLVVVPGVRRVLHSA